LISKRRIGYFFFLFYYNSFSATRLARSCRNSKAGAMSGTLCPNPNTTESKSESVSQSMCMASAWHTHVHMTSYHWVHASDESARRVRQATSNIYRKNEDTWTD